MPRVCTACSHAEHRTINAAIVAGEPKRAIAARFDLSESAVKRHAADHLPSTLLRAVQSAEVAEAEALLDQVKSIQRRARAYETQAALSGDLRVALLALREERATVALAARMTGQLDAPVPATPFTPLVFTALDPETGTEIVLDPYKMFPDPKPQPDPTTVMASIRAAQVRDARPAAGGNGPAA